MTTPQAHETPAAGTPAAAAGTMVLRRGLEPFRPSYNLGGMILATSLVNVVLLLLLFFVLSSAFTLQPGISIDPPRSIFGTGAQSNRYIVTVQMIPDAGAARSTGASPGSGASPAAGANASAGPVATAAPALREAIFFNDHLMTLEELDAAFAKLPKQQRGSTSIVVRADKSVPWDLVMKISNAAIAHELGVILATQRG
ncbi:hypothetical protein DB346_17680 [Verrucomicrobia bacterium LW23]|nr:hypothetical protein DB346_17680 [Verrucomicrobia bacterium LW23]